MSVTFSAQAEQFLRELLRPKKDGTDTHAEWIRIFILRKIDKARTKMSTPSRPILPSWSGAAKHGRGAAGISLHFPLTSRRTCTRWRLPVF